MGQRDDAPPIRAQAHRAPGGPPLPLPPCTARGRSEPELHGAAEGRRAGPVAARASLPPRRNPPGQGPEPSIVEQFEALVIRHRAESVTQRAGESRAAEGSGAEPARGPADTGTSLLQLPMERFRLTKEKNPNSKTRSPTNKVHHGSESLLGALQGCLGNGT